MIRQHIFTALDEIIESRVWHKNLPREGWALLLGEQLGKSQFAAFFVGDPYQYRRELCLLVAMGIKALEEDTAWGRILDGLDPAPNPPLQTEAEA